MKKVKKVRGWKLEAGGSRTKRVIVIFFLSSILYPLSSIFAASGNPLLREDLSEGRVVDVVRVKKLTGTGGFLFFKSPKYGYMLEGYIRGVITDYDHRPIEGVTVRALLTQAQEVKKNKKKTEEELLLEETGASEEFKKELTMGSPNFDVGVTDADGVYRVRFSFPIIRGKVDIRGKLFYNPGWAQQHDVLGQSYEPQAKESEFRLFYEKSSRLLVFSEGIRTMIVRPVRNIGGKISPISLRGSPKPETAQPIGSKTEVKEEGEAGGGAAKRPQAAEKAGEKPASGEDDFFKGFNFGP